ncbi:MerR family transcriptional regulator [Pseudoflavonifractor phocaeensis]|uniref:MerR family transcriptional regulator n=1 Tax=Pseudoflavonifractor phocaeensis TaxID=1870988 RepID=UPI00195C69A1|nr:MerR family transcriptional regulator [Pseudoflavonifractor phocaeensis]MBM6871604.1 MerR family transcriptional regulator [Pseudoflavonifractor phocaeensis]MBM6937437.1 MerR family transcriptional regulator [Pseudoflavonifractor phocaeensis]
MTIEEASERYEIPMHILRTYESWGLCGAVKKVMGDWQYDETDLERLSVIMTLHDVGFTAAEVEAYMRLLLERPHTEEQRLRMLEVRRAAALDEIHFKERQLQRLDDLRYEIRNKQREVPKNACI